MNIMCGTKLLGAVTSFYQVYKACVRVGREKGKRFHVKVGVWVCDATMTLNCLWMVW